MTLVDCRGHLASESPGKLFFVPFLILRRRSLNKVCSCYDLFCLPANCGKDFPYCKHFCVMQGYIPKGSFPFRKGKVPVCSLFSLPLLTHLYVRYICSHLTFFVSCFFNHIILSSLPKMCIPLGMTLHSCSSQLLKWPFLTFLGHPIPSVKWRRKVAPLNFTIFIQSNLFCTFESPPLAKCW